ACREMAREIVARAVERCVAVRGAREQVHALAAECGDEDEGRAERMRPKDAAVIVALFEYAVGERLVAPVRKLAVKNAADISAIAGGMAEAGRIARGDQRREEALPGVIGAHGA